jgi:hypothetical protein
MRLLTNRTIAIGLIIAAVGTIFWGVFIAKGLAAHVTLIWSYDYGPTPACSETRATDCIDHFEIMDITAQKKRLVIPSVSNPNTAVGKVDKISAEFKYGPPFGLRTMSVIAVKRNRNGYRVTSDPYAARISVFIRPFLRLRTRQSQVSAKTG